MLSEIVKIWRGEQPDKCGLLLIVLVVILIFAGVIIPPLAIILELDPIYILVQVHRPKMLTKFSTKFLVLIIRSIWAGWCALEATRIYVFVAIPTMTLCNIYLRILNTLKNSPLNNRTLFLFSQLHCINQILIPIIKIVAGTLMGAGYFMFVFGNWLIISCWGVLPIEVYFVNGGILMICYFILFQTLPLAAKCNEVSCDLIVRWKQELGKNVGFKRYWTKTVRAQRAIAFYYALTKFERSTKVNYYSVIIDGTINALLVL